jgi:hypothetical protein
VFRAGFEPIRGSLSPPILPDLEILIGGNDFSPDSIPVFRPP